MAYAVVQPIFPHESALSQGKLTTAVGRAPEQPHGLVRTWVVVHWGTKQDRHAVAVWVIVGHAAPPWFCGGYQRKFSTILGSDCVRTPETRGKRKNPDQVLTHRVTTDSRTTVWVTVAVLTRVVVLKTVVVRLMVL